nr:uncharacterized protein LOC129059666 [Pongo abelii]
MSGCCDAGGAGLRRGSRGRGRAAGPGLSPRSEDAPRGSQRGGKGRRGGERRGGFRAKWRAGPTGRCPTPPSPCPSGEKPLGGGGAFKTKKCGLEPGGRGWRGRRRRRGRTRAPASFRSSRCRGALPTTRRSCGGEGGGWLRSAAAFHFTFADLVWKERARSATPRGCSAPISEPRVRSVPAAGLCPKTLRAIGTCPAAARPASRAGCHRPALAASAPPARKPTRPLGVEELRPPLSVARTRPRSGPGFLPLGVECSPGCGFSRHTFSQDLAVLPRLDSNSWAQVVLLPQSPE